MNEVIDKLVGQHVKVWQVGTENYYYTEEGLLEAYDHPWLQLQSDTGDLLCLSAYAIRMIRPRPAAEEAETVFPQSTGLAAG
jgi:hypothetical protein